LSKIKLINFLIVLAVINMLVASCSSVDFFSRTSISSNNHNLNTNEISLLTYNIKAIFEKEENQINNLMAFVNKEEYDFVVFQELFDESTRDEIIEKADPNIFNTFISRIDYNSFPEFLFQDAGLFMMSKYPRVDLSNINFGDDIKNSNGVIHMILEKEFSRTNDYLANKSVLGVLFNINDSTELFLFTAHVQAAGSTEQKQFQLNQIKNFIDIAIKSVVYSKEKIFSKDLIVLLAGDFNSNAYDNNRFNQFRRLLGYPRDLHKEFHRNNEEYTFRDRERRYDYIMSYDTVGDFDLKKIFVKSINVANVFDDNGESISDHRGIKATLKID
jgi:endonuclease/exonuclease/phosphatase family metal-dependent hydrolase